jgi:protein-S-isoprenylcysteine O-methyltransferase Ste14
MWTLLRHVFAIVVLPVTVTVFVPVWIAQRYGITLKLPSGAEDAVPQTLGTALLAAGVALFSWSLYHFATQGRGTLAPWDPPRRLVLRGPYRFVRNPMISGVTFVLVGEALVLESLPHAAWAAVFAVLNLVYIPLLEEPRLEARLGEEYRRYREHVPRFLPRLRAWNSEDESR